MITQNEIVAIQTRLYTESQNTEAPCNETSLAAQLSNAQLEILQLTTDAKRLVTEVLRLKAQLTQLATSTTQKIEQIAIDFETLDAESNRLRIAKQSAEFERDATVSLLCQVAQKAGITVGKTQNHAVLDLPAGQVSWEFLPEETHLLEALPAYSAAIQPQTMHEVYAKVMNPGIV